MVQITQLEQLLPAVHDAVRAASQLVRDMLAQQPITATAKSDGSPVTVFDIAVSDFLINKLQSLQLNIPIVSEESLAHANGRLTAQAIWLIDPIDGTREFVNGSDEYTINVALILDGYPALGVVAVPAMRRIYEGYQGGGARIYDAADIASALKVPPRRADPIIATSHSPINQQLRDWIDSRDFTRIVAVGSSLKLCYVADGTIDMYPRLSPQMEWDVAAADAVLRAAGGMVHNYTTGQPLRYNNPDMTTPYYIASNGQPL